ncbi:MAG: MFS transporter [Defluviitaleaceae bacterium]|nr:MFS transporter [Defluviitaleaceae bacterium]
MPARINRNLVTVVLFYLIYFMGVSVFANFMPIFLTEHVGMTSYQLGIILAVGPVSLIFVQPMWGLRADRARYKNTVLILLLLLSLLASFLIPLHYSFWYIIGAIFLFNCFMTAINPVSDTITVELCQNHKWDFGRIRMAGAIGYSVMGLVAGIVISGVTLRLFPLFGIMMVLTIGIVCFMPRVPGHQREKVKAPYLQLLRNKKLLTVIIISFAANFTLTMHYGFFAVYFRELGGTTALLGLAVFCASMLELPFAFFSKKVIAKLGGPEKTLLLSIGVMAIRWALASMANTPYMLLLVNCLHGFSFIVLTVTVTIFIGEAVPPEMKASGQALHGMLSFGLARILGSITGGFLVGLWGKSGMFMVAAGFNVLVLLIFVPLVLRRRESQV